MKGGIAATKVQQSREQRQRFLTEALNSTPNGDRKNGSERQPGRATVEQNAHWADSGKLNRLPGTPNIDHIRSANLADGPGRLPRRSETARDTCVFIIAPPVRRGVSSAAA